MVARFGQETTPSWANWWSPATGSEATSHRLEALQRVIRGKG
jgi:hypothetical protein